MQIFNHNPFLKRGIHCNRKDPQLLPKEANVGIQALKNKTKT
jgi:hypothetical protein